MIRIVNQKAIWQFALQVAMHTRRWSHLRTARSMLGRRILNAPLVLITVLTVIIILEQLGHSTGG